MRQPQMPKKHFYFYLKYVDGQALTKDGNKNEDGPLKIAHHAIVWCLGANKAAVYWSLGAMACLVVLPPLYSSNFEWSYL